MSNPKLYEIFLTMCDKTGIDTDDPAADLYHQFLDEAYDLGVQYAVDASIAIIKGEGIKP